MEKTNKMFKWLKKSENILILLYCAIVATGVGAVMLFVYEPDINSLGALGSVCLDVISIMVILMMIISQAYEKIESTRTGKLFQVMMLANMWALFMDFMNWALDGNLAFGDMTFAFTLLSLCMGSVLAAIYILYLCSYMNEMHGLKNSFRFGRICVILNVLSFLITLILGITKQAFEYVDGHYQTGALYDIITIIPVLTLLVMTGYLIAHVKIIGKRDVVAIVGYVVIMIAGALIEAVFVIGTTYVGVAIANIFVYVMLQNNLINRVKKQKEQLSEQVNRQYEVLESMAGIYTYVYYADMINHTVRRFDQQDDENEIIDMKANPHSSISKKLYDGLDDVHKEKFWEYTDLSTLGERMANEKVVTAEFCHKRDGWFRAQYIRIGDAIDEPISRVIFAVRNIDEEKKNVEKWIRRSNTDELTGLYNRHAYEDDAASLDKGKNREGLAYVSIDVNGLKNVNDTLGHDAGDELIVGAGECMRQAIGAYGRLYRTGGDEFVALIHADDEQLETIKADLAEVTEKWRGKRDMRMNLSCGYVSQTEAADKTLHQLAVLADERMYEEKRRYYQKKGVDRRGQKDAHVALCALYEMILKADITRDVYEVISVGDNAKENLNMNSDKISDWFSSVTANGLVHPEDLDEFRKKTSLEYISKHFKDDKASAYVLYRKKIGEEYNTFIIEMIPANDYAEDDQTVFIYLKIINKQ
ncbi:MAG: GGDEF domain-containing protein [Lachnospiraceae bacterium]|nr:GGDEF domain-containing protein [Lachnospiraceae bacterium]